MKLGFSSALKCIPGSPSHAFRLYEGAIIPAENHYKNKRKELSHSHHTVNLSSPAALFIDLGVRLVSVSGVRPRLLNPIEYLSRGLDDDLPFRSVQSLFIRRQRFPLFDLDLTHHD